jgi:hypothetical protein
VPTSPAPDAPYGPVIERYGLITLIGVADRAPRIVPLARSVTVDDTPALLDGTRYSTLDSGEARSVPCTTPPAARLTERRKAQEEETNLLPGPSAYRAGDGNRTRVASLED